MLTRVLIANRGEIAVRISRTAADLGIETVAVFARDDAGSAHCCAATTAVALAAMGPRAYLDGAALIAAALAAHCDAVHPGYGFLSENADFATACIAAGLIFIGPTPITLRALGDKAAARALAKQLGLPLQPGTTQATSLSAAQQFFAAMPASGAMMIKACAGGGGRGIRIVNAADDIEHAFTLCQSEAKSAFGNADLYVEVVLQHARHIEVQIVGDGAGAVIALGERECTLQRRHQKLIEMAPSPSLPAALRNSICSAAVRMAQALNYHGLGTFEFLLDATAGQFVFMEANPRLQVEHTVTEEAYGLDLVALQFQLAAGATLATLGLVEPAARTPTRRAVQMRINAERMGSDGSVSPTAGQIDTLNLPSGPNIRVDTHAYQGYAIAPAYDSLLAKVVVSLPISNSPEQLLAKAARALSELRIAGVETNTTFVRALLDHPSVQSNTVTTRFIDEQLEALVLAAQSFEPMPTKRATPKNETAYVTSEQTLVAPLLGSVVSVAVKPGDRVAMGATLAVLDSMKMEHVIEAASAGVVHAVHIVSGVVVAQGQPLFEFEPLTATLVDITSVASKDPNHIRPDLQQVRAAHAFTEDKNRPDAVIKRHALGMRTARENLADLLDADSLIEYGALVVAAQRRRRGLEDLQINTPADGLITGLGTVNAANTTPDKARVAVMAYDYTVLAGTQGKLNHKKSDRLLDLAEQWKLPLVLLAEGGGGRPGDTDSVGVAGLDGPTFYRFARLSGQVPVIGVVAGRCFAGNAALLGCCDVIISTQNASIGMGGPAMIEGGGLGIVAPDNVGPPSVQSPNGVIDVLVADEAAAIATTKTMLAFIQGNRPAGPSADQRQLRHAIPENRLRVYDIRAVVALLADTNSVLELRRDFGLGAVTAFVRIDGKPFALIANNPKHLGGALDGPACDKIARFLQLADSYGLPVISLCDTPGFMVGPDSEKTAMVRRTSRMFVVGAALRVPVFAIILRKGYGLGAMAMAAGSFRAPMFTVSWPSGEFGPMGLEGAVRLGFRKELAAVEGAERETLYAAMVAEQYARGRAINMASFLEIDAVIDPADTRAWLLRGLASVPSTLPPRRTFVDTW